MFVVGWLLTFIHSSWLCVLFLYFMLFILIHIIFTLSLSLWVFFISFLYVVWCVVSCSVCFFLPFEKKLNPIPIFVGYVLGRGSERESFCVLFFTHCQLQFNSMFFFFCCFLIQWFFSWKSTVQSGGILNTAHTKNPRHNTV